MNATAVRWVGATIAATALAAVGAAAAWACTQQAYITIDPDHGPPGSEVTVAGRMFPPDGNVTIYWNEAAGEVLAATRGADFNVLVTIPRTAEGIGYVYAVATDAEGRFAGSARWRFTVTDASSSPGAATVATEAPARPDRAGERSTNVRTRSAMATGRPDRTAARASDAVPVAPAEAAPAPRAASTERGDRAERRRPSEAAAVDDPAAGQAPVGSLVAGLLDPSPAPPSSGAVTAGVLLVAAGVASLLGGVAAVLLRSRQPAR